MTNCDIIHDLLPLYHDKACSPASRALVDEHVSSCASCREMLSELDEPLSGVPAETQTPWGGSPPVNSFLPPASRLKQAKNRLVRRTALAVTAVFCAVGLAAAGGASLYGEFERERPVPWSQTMLAGTEAGASGTVHLDFSLVRYARASCLFRRVTIDGQEKDVAILQLSQTWARKTLDTNLSGPEQVALGAGTGLTLGRGGQRHDAAYGPEYAPEYWNPAWEYSGTLSAVYYLDSPSPIDLKDAPLPVLLDALARHGTLLWERDL